MRHQPRLQVFAVPRVHFFQSFIDRFGSLDPSAFQKGGIHFRHKVKIILFGGLTDAVPYVFRYRKFAAQLGFPLVGIAEVLKHYLHLFVAVALAAGGEHDDGAAGPSGFLGVENSL